MAQEYGKKLRPSACSTWELPCKYDDAVSSDRLISPAMEYSEVAVHLICGGVVISYSQ
jgi:hypothetical protein